MNIAKNMEAIFLAAVCVTAFTTAATAATPVKRIDPPSFAAKADTPMTVVTITGKRIGATSKTASR